MNGNVHVLLVRDFAYLILHLVLFEDRILSKQEMRDNGLLLVGHRVYVAELLCVQDLRDLTVDGAPFSERSIIIVLFLFWRYCILRLLFLMLFLLLNVLFRLSECFRHKVSESGSPPPSRQTVRVYPHRCCAFHRHYPGSGLVYR